MMPIGTPVSPPLDAAMPSPFPGMDPYVESEGP